MARKAKAKQRILVADDDPEILTLLSLRLKSRGYEVFEAIDGETALEQARGNKPDLVILDVMMPQKNGWEVARELKQDATTKDIGIIILTAIGEKMNEITSPLYGADAYIDKPFEFQELESAIESVLERRARCYRPGVLPLAKTPPKIVGIGLNSRAHAAEMKKPLPEEPLLFMKPPSALIGPGQPIVRPAGYERVDYEGELAIVI